jgi:hypothetical protein
VHENSCSLRFPNQGFIVGWRGRERHGALLVQSGGSTRISQSPTPRSSMPVVELNVWEGDLFEIVQISSVTLGNFVP